VRQKQAIRHAETISYLATRVRDRVDEARGNLLEWHGRGFSAGGNGTRSSDIPDLSRFLSRNDQATKDLAELDELLETALRALTRLDRICTASTEVTAKVPENWTVNCENEKCLARISMEGNDRPREGLCQRCYKHLKRYGVMWPRQRVEGRSTA
jgi:hypothetical protein